MQPTVNPNQVTVRSVRHFEIIKGLRLPYTCKYARQRIQMTFGPSQPSAQGNKTAGNISLTMYDHLMTTY